LTVLSNTYGTRPF